MSEVLNYNANPTHVGTFLDTSRLKPSARPALPYSKINENPNSNHKEQKANYPAHLTIPLSAISSPLIRPQDRANSAIADWHRELVIIIGSAVVLVMMAMMSVVVMMVMRGVLVLMVVVIRIVMVLARHVSELKMQERVGENLHVSDPSMCRENCGSD